MCSILGAEQTVITNTLKARADVKLIGQARPLLQLSIVSKLNYAVGIELLPAKPAFFRLRIRFRQPYDETAGIPTATTSGLDIPIELIHQGRYG